jgi:hypothetical protein
VQYEVVIPIGIKDKTAEGLYYNFGIDFWLQHITATNKLTNQDEVIVNLKTIGIQLDNKLIKDYKIVKEKSYTIIKIKSV